MCYKYSGCDAFGQDSYKIFIIDIIPKLDNSTIIKENTLHVSNKLQKSTVPVTLYKGVVIQ